MNGAILSNIAALAFSLLAIITSTITALRQTRIMQNANLLPIIAEVFDRFRESDFKQHLGYVSTELWEQHPPTKGIPFDDLPEEARRHATPVASFFGLVGMLAANGMISDLMVASYMGRSIVRAWTHLEPYIRNERERRGDPNWYLFFEHLASIVTAYPPSKIDSTLRLRRMPVVRPDSAKAPAHHEKGS
jgi:hypothetical protein